MSKRTTEKLVLTIDEPSIKDLPKWEFELLVNPLVDVITEFYKNPDNNLRAYEKWLEERNNDKQAPQ